MTNGVDADALHLGRGAMLYQYDVTGAAKLPLRFMAHAFTAAALNHR